MMNQQQPKQTKPKPRMLDNMLEAYIKVGGVIGVGLAIATFCGICLGSYWLFYIKHFLHLASAGGIGIGDIIIIMATFFVAGTSAVFVFFSASIFWMPILIGFIFFVPFLQHIVLSLLHMHHS